MVSPTRNMKATYFCLRQFLGPGENDWKACFLCPKYSSFALQSRLSGMYSSGNLIQRRMTRRINRDSHDFLYSINRCRLTIIKLYQLEIVLTPAGICSRISGPCRDTIRANPIGSGGHSLKASLMQAFKYSIDANRCRAMASRVGNCVPDFRNEPLHIVREC